MDDITLICNQTNYSETQARIQLELLGDPIKVIRDYLKPPIQQSPPVSTHQMVFREIGKFMEDKYRTVGR